MTDTVDAIVDVYGDVLGIADPSRESRFIALGGTSLTAAKVALALRERLSAPTIKVRDVLEHDTPEKLARFIDTLDQDVGAPPPQRNTMRAPTDDVEVPLTVQQQAIWFLEQFTPGNFAYNTTSILHFDGALDVDRFKSALQRVVARHGLLASRFPLSKGTPVIRKGADDIADFAYLDCRNMNAAAIEETVLEFGRKSFDLGSEAAIFWRLMQTGERRFDLVQVEHHFVHDGWSMWRVLHDLAACYRSLGCGDAPFPGPAPTPYGAYSRHQAEWLNGDEAARALDALKTKLQNIPDAIRFPQDPRRPDVFSFRGGTVHCQLPAQHQDKLKRFCERASVTPFAALMAACAVYLSETASAPRLSLGTMLRNRNNPEFEDTVGMFVNTCAMVLEPGGRESFAHFARTVQDELLELQNYESLPFPYLARHLDFPRDAARNPLFQVCFSMNDWPEQSLDFGDELDARLSLPSNGGAKFDLDIVLADPATYAFLWRYYSELFTRENIESMIADYHARLLELLD